VTVKTYTLDGFCRALRELIDHAERGRLISASINLSPDGLGHYSFKLLDGTAMAGMAELEGEDSGAHVTGPTAPGKGQR
jgi:hypothetical protein